MGGAAAQLGDHLLSMQEAMSCIPGPHKLGVVACGTLRRIKGQASYTPKTKVLTHLCFKDTIFKKDGVGVFRFLVRC